MLIWRHPQYLIGVSFGRKNHFSFESNLEFDSASQRASGLELQGSEIHIVAVAIINNERNEMKVSYFLLTTICHSAEFCFGKLLILYKTSARIFILCFSKLAISLGFQNPMIFSNFLYKTIISSPFY